MILIGRDIQCLPYAGFPLTPTTTVGGGEGVYFFYLFFFLFIFFFFFWSSSDYVFKKSRRIKVNRIKLRLGFILHMVIFQKYKIHFLVNGEYNCFGVGQPISLLY
jgi:hypothetical protein